MKASHKDRFVKFTSGKGALSVQVLAGQFVFGRNKAADVFGWSPSTLWKRMQKLVDMGCIIINSDKQYSIITICNWSIYQPDENIKVTTKEQASDKQVTSKEQASDTNKNVKNVENEEKKENNHVEIGSRQREIIPYADIINFLNEKAGTSFKPETQSTKSHIRARWAEKFRLEDFKAVIEHKVDEWKTNAEMCQYLRPTTLFGTKFEAYLQAAQVGAGQQNLYGKFGKWKDRSPSQDLQ